MGCCVDLNEVCGVKFLLIVFVEVKFFVGYVLISIVVLDVVFLFLFLFSGGRIIKKFI